MAVLNNTQFSFLKLTLEFQKGSDRGPEFSTLEHMGPHIVMGFHRLAINGLNVSSHQPLTIDGVSLVCNGEIYNYRELYAMLGVQPHTESDCEVIIHLFLRYGFEQTMQMIDGEFAFVLYDRRSKCETNKEGTVYIARDPYGVRPLYIYESLEDNMIAVASELKVLTGFTHKQLAFGLNDYIDAFEDAQHTKQIGIVHQFVPGTFSQYTIVQGVCTSWSPVAKNTTYHTMGITDTYQTKPKLTLNMLKGIRETFISAVEKRCSSTQRPIACLLSGGLDSSLVASIVSAYQRKHGLPPIETYSIGLAESEDLRYAARVARHLGTKHTELVVSERDFLEAIPKVVAAIESYDTTTVRASIGNYLIGRYISQNSDAKVVFNGDGADEVMGGYLYMGACPDAIEYDKETRRLLKEIHTFDVLRSDKCIASHGLEPRTPFLDRAFVQHYLSISPAVRKHAHDTYGEKNLMRRAFAAEMTFDDKPFLPTSVLWRRKEAFSDGVSKTSRSLYEIIREHTDSMLLSRNYASYTHNIPTTSEQLYYRTLFDAAYPDCGHLIPHFWMPKYVDASDASARTLALYSKGTPVPNLAL